MSCDATLLTQAELTAVTDNVPTLADIDAFWLVINGEIVFMMQIGFMLLEVGSVRAQHAKAICVKNVIDFLICTMTWFTLGYGIAFGDRGGVGDMWGTTKFFAEDMDLASGEWAMWFFQWTFASATCTIVSGAGAERCSFAGYILSTFLLSLIIYPTVVHWCWSSDAWLANGSHDDIAFFDFAGSGVVHMTGGSVALMLVTAIGAREGRFNEKGEVQSLSPHNLVLAAAGTLLLVMGWFGFNGGSVLAASGGSSALAGRVCVITAVGAATGGLCAFFIHYFTSGFIKLEVLMNGMLAGCVSVTAGASVLQPFTAVISGVVGGVVYVLASDGLLKLRIDDPLDASPIHGACGIWGLMAVGLLADEEGVKGMFYGEPKQLAYQLVGTVVILLWCMGVSGCIYNGINFYKKSILRVVLEIELAGDLVLYGGSAYPQFETDSVPPEGDICTVTSNIQDIGTLKAWNADIIETSTRLFQRTLKDTVARFEGYEASGTPENVMCCVFHNVMDAAKYAVGAHDDLLKADWPEELLTHASAAKEGELYAGLRARFSMAIGFCEKSLDRSNNRLKYDGAACDICDAILANTDDGGITLIATDAMNLLQADFSHRIHELGEVIMLDVGKYQFDEWADPISLIQVLPKSLAKRPAAVVHRGKMLLKGYATAPGVEAPGTAVAFVFCAIATADKQPSPTATALVNDCMNAQDGYMAKTANNISLLTFSTANQALSFCTAVSDGVANDANLKFTAGLHMGIPVAIVPNKGTGRADYTGPVVNATARLMALGGDNSNQAFKTGNSALSVSDAAYMNLETGQRGGLNSAGKFNLKGISNGMEVYTRGPGTAS